jgi:Tol biopolymer transport system component
MRHRHIRITRSLWAFALMLGCENSSAPVNTVSRVVISPSPLNVVVGSQHMISATAIDQGGSPMAVTCTWSTSAPGIALVSNAGLLSAVSPGTSLIGVTCGEMSAVDTVTVASALPLGTRLIVFETPGGSVNGNKNIYAVNADGTGHRTLLSGESDGYPVAFETDVWDRLAPAPNGTRLGYEDGGALFVMNADGSARRMPDQPGSTDNLNAGAAWSPEGTRIAFASFQWYWADQETGIYLTNPDIGTCCLNTATTRLTTGNDWWPAWSPDGSKIAFARYDKSYFINPGTNAGSDIFVMRADGSGVTQLTHKGWPISGLAWSPNGSKIAFSANTGDCQPILIMNADGSGISQLTDCAGVDHNPSWSPDGTSIVFERNQSIYTFNADGSGALNLIAAGAVNPAWLVVR